MNPAEWQAVMVTGNKPEIAHLVLTAIRLKEADEAVKSATAAYHSANAQGDVSVANSARLALHRAIDDQTSAMYKLHDAARRIP